MVYKDPNYMKKYLGCYQRALAILRDRYPEEFEKILKKLKGGLKNGKNKYN